MLPRLASDVLTDTLPPHHQMSAFKRCGSNSGSKVVPIDTTADQLLLSTKVQRVSHPTPPHCLTTHSPGPPLQQELDAVMEHFAAVLARRMVALEDDPTVVKLSTPPHTPTHTPHTHTLHHYHPVQSDDNHNLRDPTAGQGGPQKTHTLFCCNTHTIESSCRF